MAKRRPLYEALGADDKDDVETITRKYRRKAKELHPDKRPGDVAAAEEFKRVAEAFEVLSDPVKRLTYDQTGEVPDDRNDPRRRGERAGVDRARPADGPSRADRNGGRREAGHEVRL